MLLTGVGPDCKQRARDCLMPIETCAEKGRQRQVAIRGGVVHHRRRCVGDERVGVQSHGKKALHHILQALHGSVQQCGGAFLVHGGDVHTRCVAQREGNVAVPVLTRHNERG